MLKNDISIAYLVFQVYDKPFQRSMLSADVLISIISSLALMRAQDLDIGREGHEIRFCCQRYKYMTKATDFS
jgi:hypothetical protein